MINFNKDIWVDAMLERMPDMDRITIEGIFDRYYNPVDLEMYNPVRLSKRIIPVTTLIDEINSKQLIMNELGTLFYNHKDIISPSSSTEDKLYTGRSIQKMKYKEFKSKGDKLNADRWNNRQNMSKRSMNTFYGIQASPYCKYFSASTAGSITCKARNVTVNGIMAAERQYGHYKYRELGYVQHMINTIGKEDSSILDKYEVPTVTDEMVIDKIYDTVDNIHLYEREYVVEYIKNLSPVVKTMYYYKSNFDKALEYIPKFKNRFRDIMKQLIKNNEPYTNPYKPPVAKDEIEELARDCNALCGGVYSRYDLVKTFSDYDRQRTLTVDTDSAIIAIDKDVNMLMDTVKDELEIGDYDFKTAMSTLHILMLDRTIDIETKKYANMYHVPEKYHENIAFKNEFLFSKYILTDVKKSYAAIIEIIEGFVIPSEMEVKGLQMKKSTVNSDIGKMCQDILEFDILRVEKFSYDRLFASIRKAMDKVANSVLTSHEYFLLSKISKPAEMFTRNDYRAQAVKLYNAMASDTEKIETPGGFKMVLVNLDGFREKYPKKYQLMVESVIRDRVLSKVTDIESADKHLSNVSKLAIPIDMDISPEWLNSIIDVEAYTSLIVNTLKPILKALGIVTTGKNITKLTNNIKL